MFTSKLIHSAIILVAAFMLSACDKTKTQEVTSTITRVTTAGELYHREVNEKNPGGKDEVNQKVFMGLKNLRTFMESLDYISMRRDRETVRRVTGYANINVISEKGKQYAMYMHHSHLNYGEFAGTYYIPNSSVFEPVITAVIEKGNYAVTFIEPETLKVIDERKLVSDGGETEIKCPKYALDIAIKIIAK